MIADEKKKCSGFTANKRAPIKEVLLSNIILESLKRAKTESMPKIAVGSLSAN